MKDNAHGTCRYVMFEAKFLSFGNGLIVPVPVCSNMNFVNVYISAPAVPRQQRV